MDIATFKTSLTAALTATQVDAGDPATQLNNYVNAVADAVEALLLSCEIEYVTGLEAGTTPVTGTFSGGLI